MLIELALVKSAHKSKSLRSDYLIMRFPEYLQENKKYLINLELSLKQLPSVISHYRWVQHRNPMKWMIGHLCWWTGMGS